MIEQEKEIRITTVRLEQKECVRLGHSLELQTQHKHSKEEKGRATDLDQLTVDQDHS